MKKPSFPVIAYERFSDQQQAEGDSERRQKAGAVLWTEEFGGRLVELAEPYEDHGKSGFKGNKQKALLRLEKDIEAGRIKAGTTIYFEHVDRLGRRGITPTQELIAKFFRYGINIGIRLPTPKHYLADEATNNLALAVEIACLAYSARVYSESLSDRIGNVWNQQRKAAAENNSPIQSLPPGWIDKVTEGKNIVYKLNDHAETVRHIFKRIKQVGTTKLAAELNHDPNRKPWGYSGKWGRSHIAQIIRDQRVLGFYQPHVMKGQKRVPEGDPIALYPPVGITEEDWLVAQQAAENRKKEKGPSSIHVNIFAGLIHSANDGSPLRIATTGTKDKPLRRLKSAAATEGVAGACNHTIDLIPFEEAIFRFLRELKPSDLIAPDRSRELEVLNGRIDAVRSKIEKLDARISTHSEDIDRIMPAIRKLETELETLNAERRKIATNSIDDQNQSIEEIKTQSNLEDAEFRLRLRNALKTVCERIDVLTDKAGSNRNSPIATIVAITLRNGNVRRFLLWKKKAYYLDHGVKGSKLTNNVPGSICKFAEVQERQEAFYETVNDMYGELENPLFIPDTTNPGNPSVRSKGAGHKKSQKRQDAGSVK